ERQQGALIPLAVVTYLLAAGRLRFDRAGLALGIRVAALPAVVAALYYAWLTQVHSVPQMQRNFLDNATIVGWHDAALLAGRLAFITLMYLGLFALPLTVAALPSVRQLMRGLRPAGRLLAAGWIGIVGIGLATF